MPAVSVIILVCNSEKYLPKALGSLFGQTLEDMEYVIVDDGSTDGSMDVLQEMLKEYPHRAGQVRIISNETNLGQAASRRRGVEASTGDYIIHCDSDDWIEPEMYAKLYDKAICGGFDMVLCRIHEVDDSGREIRMVDDDFSVEDVTQALMGFKIHHHLPDKLVIRSAYEGLRFPPYDMWEDAAISVQLASRCRSFGFVDEILYHYLRHPGSIASQAPSIRKTDQMKGNVDFIESCLGRDQIAGKYSREYRHLKRMVKVYAQRLPRPYYVALYPEENLRLFFDKEITLAEKLGHVTAMMGIHGFKDKLKRK